jgi:hypothetical protein
VVDRAEKAAPQSSAPRSRAGTSNFSNSRGAKPKGAGRGSGCRNEKGGVDSPKITPDHLGRAAVVYVRQSTMAQVTGNLESQRQQYDLGRGSRLCIGNGDRRRSGTLGIGLGCSALSDSSFIYCSCVNFENIDCRRWHCLHRNPVPQPGQLGSWCARRAYCSTSLDGAHGARLGSQCAL